MQTRPSAAMRNPPKIAATVSAHCSAVRSFGWKAYSFLHIPYAFSGDARALILSRMAHRHPLRRYWSTNRRRPNNSSILKNSSIKCLTSLAYLPVHLHEIIRDRTRLILGRIHLYIACIIKATGFTGSQIRKTTRSFEPSCPSDCDDRHFILGDLASVGLCRWQVGRNFKSIILINPILLTHIEGDAVRGRPHRWDNQSKSSPFVTRNLPGCWARGKGFLLFSATLPAFPMMAAAVFRRQSRTLKARIRAIPSAQFTKALRRPRPILKGIYGVLKPATRQFEVSEIAGRRSDRATPDD